MAFKLLIEPQRLLEPGDLVSFNGEWPQFWRNKVFRVVRNSQTIRDRVVAPALVPDGEITIDVDAAGLNPEFEPWLYQTRIGLNSGQWRFYVRWPSNDFAMQLQDPNFPVNPADADLRNIGFLDANATKIENATLTSPDEALRFQFMWVKDQLPAFLVRSMASTTGPALYQKVVVRFLLNICGLAEETDPNLLQRVASGELLVEQILHYSQIGRRAI